MEVAACLAALTYSGCQEGIAPRKETITPEDSVNATLIYGYPKSKEWILSGITR